MGKPCFLTISSLPCYPFLPMELREDWNGWIRIACHSWIKQIQSSPELPINMANTMIDSHRTSQHLCLAARSQHILFKGNGFIQARSIQSSELIYLKWWHQHKVQSYSQCQLRASSWSLFQWYYAQRSISHRTPTVAGIRRDDQLDASSNDNVEEDSSAQYLPWNHFSSLWQSRSSSPFIFNQCLDLPRTYAIFCMCPEGLYDGVYAVHRWW